MVGEFHPGLWQPAYPPVWSRGGPDFNDFRAPGAVALVPHDDTVRTCRSVEVRVQPSRLWLREVKLGDIAFELRGLELVLDSAPVDVAVRQVRDGSIPPLV